MSNISTTHELRWFSNYDPLYSLRNMSAASLAHRIWSGPCVPSPVSSPQAPVPTPTEECISATHDVSTLTVAQPTAPAKGTCVPRSTSWSLTATTLTDHVLIADHDPLPKLCSQSCQNAEEICIFGRCSACLLFAFNLRCFLSKRLLALLLAPI